MPLDTIDIAIIIAYIIAAVLIGISIAKKASSSMDEYFLGGRATPWYWLGVSNASSMFDIGGTMWLVANIYVYGMKGAWLPWMWPTFNQIFLMVYLSSWIRRSNVLTGGDWISTRFQHKLGTELARISVVIFAVISVIAFLAYAFQGVGKFAEVYLPWDFTANQYAFGIMGLTTLYVVAGGMRSVVFTDIIQFILLTIVSFAVGYIAISQTSTAQIAAATPNGWSDLWFGWNLDLDWSGILPGAGETIEEQGLSLFTIVFTMMLLKGFLVSSAGAAPNYDMQRILATRNPRESALMSGIVSVALFPRWIMIGGITVLGLVYYSDTLLELGGAPDFEQVLPYVISEFIPAGIKGLLIAGLLAAFMSTFDSTVNAGSAYIVNDIYKRYLKPKASARHYVIGSYLASFLVVSIGVVAGQFVDSIHEIMGWIVSGLWGGYAGPNILKWYWWRFNSYGYFWGMVLGMAAAIAAPQIWSCTIDLYLFPIILGFSLLGCIIGSLATAPEPKETLHSFYQSVRPWGFWKPVRDQVLAKNPSFTNESSFSRDLFNIIIGISWQMTLVLAPIYIVLRDFGNLSISLVALIITTWILKKAWYDKLEKE